MPSADPRIDAYIENAAPFARPILMHLRQVVHAALPDADETIKWSMPHFTYCGKNVAGMAAFKAYCSFMIHGEGRQSSEQAGMGSFGKLAALDDLPPDSVLIEKLKAAADRIASGPARAPRQTKPPKPAISVPEDFAAALAGNAAARRTLDGFAPSHRREYLEWITSAKRADTRARRIAQALEWLAQGRKRNWQYEAR